MLRSQGPAHRAPIFPFPFISPSAHIGRAMPGEWGLHETGMSDHPKGLVFRTSSFAMVEHVLSVLRQARPDLTVNSNTFHSRNEDFDPEEALQKSGQGPPAD